MVAIAEGYRVEVPLGGTTLLTCKVTANPTPEIIWTDDNGNIMPSIVRKVLLLPYVLVLCLQIHLHSRNILTHYLIT